MPMRVYLAMGWTPTEHKQKPPFAVHAVGKGGFFYQDITNGIKKI